MFVPATDTEAIFSGNEALRQRMQALLQEAQIRSLFRGNRTSAKRGYFTWQNPLVSDPAMSRDAALEIR